MTSKIEWTDETWNPITGCSEISPGCLNCYAKAAAKSARLQQFEQYRAVKNWDGTTFFAESQLLKPLGWKSPKKIFVCSMSDLFHKNNPDEWIDKIFAVMARCPQHTFQLLTKRPANALEYLKKKRFIKFVSGLNDHGDWIDTQNSIVGLPLPNVWIGTTVENQKAADERIPLLRETPAAIRFLSCEPLLEPVYLDLKEIDFVITGGESGTGARPCHLDWIRSVVLQCKAAGVPVFVKQLGAKPIEFVSQVESTPYIEGVVSTNFAGETRKVPYKTKTKKGGNIEEFPIELQIRQFPQ